MLLKAPIEVKTNKPSLVFRTNPYGFGIEEALVQEKREGAKHQNYPEGKKARDSLLCSAQGTCKNL